MAYAALGFVVSAFSLLLIIPPSPWIPHVNVPIYPFPIRGIYFDVTTGDINLDLRIIHAAPFIVFGEFPNVSRRCRRLSLFLAVYDVWVSSVGIRNEEVHPLVLLILRFTGGPGPGK